MSNAEKARYYKELKRKKKSEINKRSYSKNSEKFKTEKAYSDSKAAKYNRGQRLKIKEQKLKIDEKLMKAKIYQRKHRLNKKLNFMQNSECQFSNRMDKCRSVHKLKKSLPVDPAKREAVLKAYIEVSPAMKCVREKISTSYGDETAEKIIANLHTFIHKSKLKRNDDSRMTMNILSASVSGESVNDPKADRNIAKKNLG